MACFAPGFSQAMHKQDSAQTRCFFQELWFGENFISKLKYYDYRKSLNYGPERLFKIQDKTGALIRVGHLIKGAAYLIFPK